jgi:hypothetical protein
LDRRLGGPQSRSGGANNIRKKINGSFSSANEPKYETSDNCNTENDVGLMCGTSQKKTIGFRLAQEYAAF